MRQWILAAALTALTAGCGQGEQQAGPVATIDPGNAAVAADAAVPSAVDPKVVPPSPAGDWAGKWIGPEGLVLDIAPVAATPGSYTLKMKYTLDDEGTFTGKATPTGIAFERAGKTETLTAATGEETGMKWLADKPGPCLVVKAGEEAYCRP